MKEKMARRWQFILDGMAVVRPEMDEEGSVTYMLVETDFSATKCYTPQEVDDAIDIAMHIIHRGKSIYLH